MKKFVTLFLMVCLWLPVAISYAAETVDEAETQINEGVAFLIEQARRIQAVEAAQAALNQRITELEAAKDALVAEKDAINIKLNEAIANQTAIEQRAVDAESKASVLQSTVNGFQQLLKDLKAYFAMPINFSQRIEPLIEPDSD